MLRTIHAFALAFWLFCLNQAEAQGSFQGDVNTKWISNGRGMQLTESFAFTDALGRVWEVPKGTIVDGASIPRVLWTIVGAPFAGKYRKASVIHDYFCETMSRPWQDVHKAFFDAQLAEGNSEYHAKLLYGGVYAWGPRWEVVNGKPRRTREAIEAPSSDDLDKLAEFIKSKNPDASSIIKYTEGNFRR